MGKRFLIGIMIVCVIITLSLIQDPAKQVKRMIQYHYYTSMIEGNERYLYFEKDSFLSGIVLKQHFYVKDQGTYNTKKEGRDIYLILKKKEKTTSFLVKMKYNQTPDHFTSTKYHVLYKLKY